MPEDTQFPNPNADSAFLQKQQAASDEAKFDEFITRVSAMPDADRRAELVKHGVSQDDYEQIIGPKNAQDLENKAAAITPAKAESEQKQIEGKGGSEAEPTQGPVEAALFAMTGAPIAEELGISLPAAVAGTASGNEFISKVQEKVAGLMPKHPVLGNTVGGLVGALLLGGGSAALSKGATPPVETEDAVDAAENAAEGAQEKPGDAAAGAGEVDGAQGEAAAVPAEAQPSSPATESKTGGGENAVAQDAEKAKGAEDSEGIPRADTSAPNLQRSAKPEATPEEQASGRIYTQEYNDRYNAAVQEARRGSVSRETQQTVAQEEPATPEEVAAMEPGTTATAERATALVNFVRDEGETIKELAGRALDEGDRDARAEAIQRIDSLVSVYDPKVQGVTAETGRSLGAFNEPTPAKYAKAMRAEVLSKIGSPGYMTEDEVLNAFRGLKSPEEIEGLSAQVGNGGKVAYAKDFFVNSYISSILSPNSVAKKAASDALNILYQIPARALGETYGDIQRAMGAAPESTITPGETAAMVRALRNNFVDAMKIGWNSAKENRPLFQEGVGYGESIPSDPISSAGTRFEGTPIGTALDWYGHIISVPGRAITGVDQAAKVFHYRMELATLAEHQGYVTALNEGRDGLELAQRASDVATGFMAKPPQWAIDQAFRTSKIETFQRELTGTLAGIDQMRQSSAVVRTIIPFFKTGSNIDRMGLERTIPFSTQAYREAFAAGGRERVLMVAKNALGDMIGGSLAYEYLKDKLTGYGPRNPQVRDLWLKDHKPYSIKIGDEWLSLTPTEPVAWQAGVVADAADMMRYLPNQDAFSVADAVTASSVREFNRQGFFSDLAGFVKTLNDMSEKGVDAKGASAGLGNLVGTIVSPQAFNDLAHGIDPVRRKTSTFIDGIRNRIPYLTETGIPERDPWGKPVVVPPGYAMNEFPAFASQLAGHDPVNEEMVRLYHSVNYAPPEVPKSIGGPASPDNPMVIQNYRDGVNLSPQQQDRWIELRGSVKNPRTGFDLKQAVSSAMNDARYQDLSDPERAIKLNRLFTSYREAARKVLLVEHPEIIDSVAARKIMRRQALAAPGPEVDMGEGTEGLEGTAGGASSIAGP